MIRIRCSHCDKKLGVPDEAAGKRIKCPQCGTVNVIPADASPGASGEQAGRSTNVLGDSFSTLSQCETSSEWIEPPRRTRVQSVLAAVGTVGKVPAYVWLLGILVIALIVAGIFIAQSTRDTWEKDHRDEIVSLDERARSQVQAGQLEAAAQTYRELVAVVGKRAIRDRSLAAVVERADRERHTISHTLRIRAGREFYEGAKEDLLAKLADADADALAGRLESAMSIYDEVIAMVAKSPHVIDELASLDRRARSARDAVRTRLGQLAEKRKAEQRRNAKRLHNVRKVTGKAVASVGTFLKTHQTLREAYHQTDVLTPAACERVALQLRGRQAVTAKQPIFKSDYVPSFLIARHAKARARELLDLCGGIVVLYEMQGKLGEGIAAKQYAAKTPDAQALRQTIAERIQDAAATADKIHRQLKRFTDGEADEPPESSAAVVTQMQKERQALDAGIAKLK